MVLIFFIVNEKVLFGGAFHTYRDLIGAKNFNIIASGNEYLSSAICIFFIFIKIITFNLNFFI